MRATEKAWDHRGGLWWRLTLRWRHFHIGQQIVFPADQFMGARLCTVVNIGMPGLGEAGITLRVADVSTGKEHETTVSIRDLRSAIRIAHGASTGLTA
jgi:hypothetical protein